MTHHPRLARAVPLLLLAAFVIVGAAQAQEHTFAIRDGIVLVDGKPIPAGELPASLDPTGQQVYLRFSGEQQPFIQVNGKLFTLRQHRLEEVRPDEAEGHRVAVFFRDSAGQASRATGDRATEEASLVSFRAAPEEPHVRVMRSYLQRLEEKAIAMQELSRAEQAQGLRPDMQQLAAEVRLEAAEASRVAEELPQLEVQSYLQEVMQHDQQLYDRLVHEWQLELEARRLAERVRALPEGMERTRHVEQLRAQLDEIFDLKQQNRQQEIEQLAQNLTELKRRLAEREAHRDRIIDYRIEQLLEGVR